MYVTTVCVCVMCVITVGVAVYIMTADVLFVIRLWVLLCIL